MSGEEDCGGDDRYRMARSGNDRNLKPLNKPNRAMDTRNQETTRACNILFDRSPHVKPYEEGLTSQMKPE